MEEMLKRARDVIAVEGTEGRNPFEVLMLLWSIATGISFASGSLTPSPILELLPGWVVTGWYILLCIGGLVGLVGVWLRNLILSLLVERAAMLIVGPSASLFASAILLQAPHSPRALSYGAAVSVFALSAFWRGYRIQSYLRKLRTALGEAASE